MWDLTNREEEKTRVTGEMREVECKSTMNRIKMRVKNESLKMNSQPLVQASLSKEVEKCRQLLTGERTRTYWEKQVRGRIAEKPYG